MLVRCGIVGCVLFCALTAAAMDAIPGEQQFQQLMQGTQPNKAGAEVGFGQMKEDYFLQLVLRTELNLGPVGLGLQIPLNLRVWDRDPKTTEKDYYGLIRREDWDQPQKFLRVIRYVRLGHKRDPFYLRVGELAADLGHGTIMGRYMNNLDVNTLRVGSQFDINTSYGGFESVINDIGMVMNKGPDSRIVAGRVFVKPYALIDPNSYLDNLAIGASLVTDFNAPLTLHQVNGQAQVTSSGALVVESRTQATVYGLDAEFEVMHNALLDLIPYVDLNQIAEAGWGLHAGILARAKMPIGISLEIPVRLEYRRFKDNYAPMYFSTFYEIERYRYPVGGATAGTPKAAALRAAPGNRGLNGYYGDLAFDFMGLLQIGAIYENYEGGDPNVAAFASVPALETMQFKAFYARTHIQGTKDIFKLDDRSMLVAQARYEMVKFVYLAARWSRRWALDTDGTFKSADDWKFGVETSFSF